MATFNLVIDKRYKNTEGKYQLAVKLSHKKQVVFLYLKEYYSEKEFKVLFVKQTFDKTILFLREKYQEKVKRASIIFNSLPQFELKIFRQRFFDTSLDVDRIITNEDKERGALRYLFDLHNNSKLKIGKIRSSTVDLFKSSLNSFLTFRKNLDYNDITSDFLTEYENWYLKKINSRGNHNSIASLASNCRHLRTVLKYALKKLIPSSYEWPFEDYSIPSYIPAKKTLSKEEIQSIIDFNQFDDRMEEYARDIWVFLYRMQGSNFIDLLLMRWSNIEGEYINFRRHKTKTTRRNNIRQQSVKITEKIKSLLEKVGNKNSPYILGLMKHETYEENYLKNKNKKWKTIINRYLKPISKKLNLSVPLDISLARDCYANTLKRSNVNPLIISEEMNHSDFRITTLHYLDQFDQETLDKANEHIL